ncbi:MAG: hypothetical protein IT328_06870 [Caldilineaceae bacterium]|nr:hypothetical protein [Caldilineaceae bacterium]
MMHAVANIQPIIKDVPRMDILREENSEVLPLIQKLCQLLADEQISYCHWKSNNALDRSASGDNDLDLLVSQADGPRFEELIRELGFKQATAPAEKQMPGVLDYFGYDPEGDKLIHVHLHYHLVLGHDMSKNYRLPIEKQYLESAVQGKLFKTPAPEYEFVVFVIRMALKHLPWDVVLGREGKLKTSERLEMGYLQARINREYVLDILTWHLPYISVQLFDACVRALQPNCPTWERIKIGQQLQTKLQANARRRLPIDISLKLWRRVDLAARRRIFNASSKYRIESERPMIALVGGDGAGKSTAVDALYRWLSKNFETTRVHMGKPAWSLTTVTARGILKGGQLLGLYPVESSFQETIQQKSILSPGYPWLVREACLARDRYGIYEKARRFANQGGVIILDRYPLPQIQSVDGPQAERFVTELANGAQAHQRLSPHRANRFTKLLLGIEERYYRQITAPGLLIVILVDPDIAVQRKTDEDAATVRKRSAEIWDVHWEKTDAYIVDGGKSKTEVLAELKALIWSKL